jgi:DNA-binding protein HU-beta
MNKSGLIEAVASRLSGGHADAARAVDAVLQSIAHGVREEGRVTISGFGTFTRKERAARTAVNPGTRQPMHIRASTTCGFRPSTALKERLEERAGSA